MTLTSLRNFNRSPQHLAWTRTAVLSLAIVFALAIVATPAVQAQTFQVIHTFTGTDGANPVDSLTIDAAGNLYGTTGSGSPHIYGTVFEISFFDPNWVLNTLYSFAGDGDGAYPGAVVITGEGTLYGTTGEGGVGCSGHGCGTVFQLAVSPRPLGALWNDRALSLQWRERWK